MVQIPNYVLCSHYPEEHKNSPCASVYQLFLGENKIKELSGFIYLMDSEDEIEKNLILLKRNEHTAFLFNGYNSLLLKSSLVILSYALIHDIPVTIYWHETSWNLRELTKQAQVSLEQLQLYFKSLEITNFVPTSQCMHAVVTAFGFPFETFRIVFEVFDISNFTPKEKPLNPNSVSFCGAGIPNYRKGIDIFSEIAFKFKKDNESHIFEWCAATPGNIDARTIKNYNLVTFSGQHKEFYKKLQEIDIFILTSRDDPSPLVALEALACNKPAFAFSTTGYVEVLPEEFIASTIDELIKKIDVFLEKHDTYDTLFFRKIAEKYTPETFIYKAFPEKVADTINIPDSSFNYIQQNLTAPKLEEKEALLLKKEGWILKKEAGIRRRELAIAAQDKASYYETMFSHYKTVLKNSRSKIRKSLYTNSQKDSRSGIQKLFQPNTKITKQKILVIGNSPSIINSKNAQIINSYDVVIRINNFITKGYEEYAGSKTSFAVITPACFPSEELSALKPEQILVFAAQHKTYEAVYERIMQPNGCKVKILKGNILSRELYFEHLPIMMDLLLTQWASTGMVAIQWAVDYFKQPIHVHGFDFSIGETGKIEHYFPHATTHDLRHDFFKEKKRFNSMLKNGELIRL